MCTVEATVLVMLHGVWCSAQLELRILAHLSECESMLEAFRLGGDFHSRTAKNMYSHVRSAVEKGEVIVDKSDYDPAHWPPGAPMPPLIKDVFRAERQKAKMLNFSIAYGKTFMGLAKDWSVSALSLDLGFLQSLWEMVPPQEKR